MKPGSGIGSRENVSGKWLKIGGASLGLIQLAIASGCAQGGMTAEAAPAGAAAAAEGQPGQAFVMPVRVSRAFFENRLAGAVRLQSALDPGSSDVRSPVAWQESAPTDPAPQATEETGPVLADFRDHQGCASFRDAGGVELCFKLMGDVSNVGLNEREMSLSGLGAWIDQELGQPCPGAEWNARFKGADRDRQGQGVDGSFTVSYLVEPQGGNCAPDARKPVQVDLTLTRI